VRRIGVVTGSRAEARCLPEGPRFVVRCSGADVVRARRHAEELASAGVEGLLSFGLAGGLDPALEAGTLLLPEDVLGGAGGRPDGPWRRDVAGRLDANGRHYRRGPILGSGGAVMAIATKAVLFAESGAAAVDMESHIVAAVAARHGLPFLVLRAVADPAGTMLPPAALAALRPDGRADLPGLLRGLIRRPADGLPLLRLARDARRGIRTLREGARSI
jgi:adenosylhomocysteine nucleosidase